MSSVLDEVSARLETLPEYVSVVDAPEAAALLALDVGTSGVRASLFDEQGREINGAQAHNKRIFATFGDVEELDADDLVDLIGRTLDQLFEVAGPAIDQVKLIAASCFWHSLLGVDRAGRPTTPVLGWANTRAGQAAKELRSRFNEREIHARTGCRLHPSYWPAKLLWLRTERPADFQATARWLSFADYLVLRLFGETASSVSMASGTGLMNQRTCQWDQELVSALELSVAELPEIAEANKTFGGLRAEFGLRWPQLRHSRAPRAATPATAMAPGTSMRISRWIGSSMRPWTGMSP